MVWSIFLVVAFLAIAYCGCGRGRAAQSRFELYVEVTSADRPLQLAMA